MTLNLNKTPTLLQVARNKVASLLEPPARRVAQIACRPWRGAAIQVASLQDHHIHPRRAPPHQHPYIVVTAVQL